MKKLYTITVTILILIMLTACYHKNSRTQQTVNSLRRVEKTPGTQVVDVSYKKDGITATYPKMIEGGTLKEMSNWNRMIGSDFDKILHIYSFHPIPGPTPSPAGEIPSILEIQYEMKLLNDKLISIFYKAYFNAKFSAYPTELVYTTNLNKVNGKRVRLKDVVKIDEAFVKDFRTWNFKTSEESNEEWNQAIRDYLSNISDEDLLMGLKEADQIGSKNLWGIYSYYTPDKIGISLSVPNYIGDHVEFEKEYSQLKDYIKTNNKIIP